MTHYYHCPLCKSDNFKQKLKCNDHFLTKEVFEICECLSCGFIFTQDHPEENQSGKYYESEEYISHTGSGKGLINRLYGIVRTFMLSRKKTLIERTSGIKKGTLLDIGSGSGFFAATMHRAGWNVSAIEINEKARKGSEEKFGIKAYDPGDLSKLSSGSFDVITLWHVLEHFHDPFRYSSEILRLLKPGGVCIAALPNSSSHDAVFYKSHWAAYDVPRHLWHFSPATFKFFAEKSGFSYEKMIPLPLDVFYISSLSEKYKGGALWEIKGMIMGKWFLFLSFFDNRYSSLIYILRKPLS